MTKRNYKLIYLPKFEEDLDEIVDYITLSLQNPHGALKLVERIENAILKRLENPVSFEPFRSNKKRRYTYYRIYVDNFVVYYVVIDDVMEVRRTLYKSRDIERII